MMYYIYFLAKIDNVKLKYPGKCKLRNSKKKAWIVSQCDGIIPKESQNKMVCSQPPLNHLW